MNELRRKTSDPQLARRAKVLVKRWRDLVIPTNASPGHTGNFSIITVQSKNWGNRGSCGWGPLACALYPDIHFNDVILSYLWNVLKLGQSRCKCSTKYSLWCQKLWNMLTRMHYKNLVRRCKCVNQSITKFGNAVLTYFGDGFAVALVINVLFTIIK